MSTASPNPMLQALTVALNSGPAQKRDDAFYIPRQQDYFYPTEDGAWTSPTSTQSPTVPTLEAPINPKAIRLISWNIDMLVGFAEERMHAALHYLDGLTSSTPAEIPVVVFLQEMTPSDLSQIKSSPWIHSRFFLTETDAKNWLSSYYGTITLIDRRLNIKRVSRIPWISKFARDGLFVDIALKHTQHDEDKVLRLCNTHLESLVADPPVRPLQLSAAARHLQDPNVACALLAGDLNAIQPFDRTLHTENELKDAYLELGGKEDSEEGYTWGYQVPVAMREKFGCSRMDKILFRGAVQPKRFERIGIDVKVAEDKREEVRNAGEEEWVTDHYGVMGDFELSDGWELKTWNEGGYSVQSELS